MHVLYDTLSISASKSGVGNYAINLIKNLLELSDNLKITLLRCPFTQFKFFKDERVREVPYYSHLFNCGRFDLFHGLNCRVPFAIKCPKVVTIHDLLWFDDPKLGSTFFFRRFLEGHFFRYAINRSVQQCQAIIAISDTSKHTIINRFPKLSSEIKTVYHGVDQEYFSSKNPALLTRAKLNSYIQDSLAYALIYSHNSPNKNHAGMIKAFVSAFRDKPYYKLIIIRRYKRLDWELEKLLQEPTIAAKVIILGYVSDPLLLNFIFYARMVLFISHYEGFGIPCVEAMALGTSLIVSQAPALREITGNAALHADSTSIEDMKQKMQILDSNDQLRATLVNLGKQRATEFNWQNSAKETLNIYQALLNY